MPSRLRPSRLAVALVGGALLPAAVAAQAPDPAPAGARPLGAGTRTGEPRLYLGFGLDVAQPVHEFRDFVANGIGFGGYGLARLGADGAVGLRADLGFLTYGRERRRVPLPGIGRLTGDLTTTNGIFWLSAGPQLMVPSGPVRPYANAGVGFAVFSTSTTLRARDTDEELARETNQSDATWAAGAGGGVLIPLSRQQRQLALLDLGARFHRNGQVRYLRKGGIVDRPDGSSRLDVIDSPADLWTFRVGLTLGAR